MTVERKPASKPEAALILLGWEWEAFESHVNGCSPDEMREILKLLEEDTGDARMENLSQAARVLINERLEATLS